MKLCDDDHEEVAFECRNCPVCHEKDNNRAGEYATEIAELKEALESRDEDVRELESAITRRDERITELENSILNMKGEINAQTT